MEREVRVNSWALPTRRLHIRRASPAAGSSHTLPGIKLAINTHHSAFLAAAIAPTGTAGCVRIKSIHRICSARAPAAPALGPGEPHSYPDFDRAAGFAKCFKMLRCGCACSPHEHALSAGGRRCGRR